MIHFQTKKFLKFWITYTRAPFNSSGTESELHLKHDTVLTISYRGESSHSLHTSPQVSTMWHRHKLSIGSQVCEYTHFYKESCLLADSFRPAWSRRQKESQCTGVCLTPCPWVPGPEGSILTKSILCSRTYNESTDPSTPNSLASEPSTLLPALRIFSPVTLICSHQT